MENEVPKIPIKAVIIVIVFIALIWFVHPLWCHHSFETVSKDVNEIHTTTDKITKRFDSISKVDVSLLEHKEDLHK